MFDCISVKDAALKWEISERRIQKLCEEGRIDGVVRFGHAWAIPKDAKKPSDKRKNINKKGAKSDFKDIGQQRQFSNILVVS